MEKTQWDIKNGPSRDTGNIRQKTQNRDKQILLDIYLSSFKELIHILIKKKKDI
jgi:hypothetical protein